MESADESVTMSGLPAGMSRRGAKRSRLRPWYSCFPADMLPSFLKHVFLRYAHALIRRSSDAWLRLVSQRVLRLRLTSLAVSLAVHAPLVWWVSGRQPAAFPVSPGLESFASADTMAGSVGSATEQTPVFTEVQEISSASEPQPVTAITQAGMIPIVDVLPPHGIEQTEITLRPPSSAQAWIERSRLIDHDRFPLPDPRLLKNLAFHWTGPDQADEKIESNGSVEATHETAANSAKQTSERDRRDGSSPSNESPTPSGDKRRSTTASEASTNLSAEASRTQSQSGEAATDSRASKASSGAEVDQLPNRLPTNPHPPYPRDAWRLALQGRVVLRVLVDASGLVETVSVHSSSGHSSLDQSALRTVRNWRFTPATRNGRAVPFEIGVPVTFRLQSPR